MSVTPQETVTPLEKVLAETRRYQHALLDFSALSDLNRWLATGAQT